MLDNLKADIKRYVKDPRTKENIYLIEDKDQHSNRQWR